MHPTLARIADEHRMCLAKFCEDEGCECRCVGIPKRSFLIISGTKYQRNHAREQRLSDCIVLCEAAGIRVVIVELKGGKDIHIRRAFEQIQRGLEVADELLRGVQIAGWCALLCYSGSLGLWEKKILRQQFA